MAGWGLTVLRVAVGLVFIAHGAQRLFGLFGGGGLSGPADTFSDLGFAPAHPAGIIWAIVAFAGGVLIFLGAWTRWAAIPLALGVIIAGTRVHLASGFFLNWALAPGAGHGYEFHLVLLAACVCLSLEGAGELSVDKLLNRNAEYALAGRQRIRSM